MKIATFNINNIKRRLPNLLGWLRRATPDVVCLQELKASDAEFPDAALQKAGYGAIFRGQKTWNGVAILGRDGQPVVTRTALPGDDSDMQSRYIEAAVNGIIVGCLYAPNGNPAARPEIQLQAGVARAPRQARQNAHKAEGAGRSGGRLQCGSDRSGHLPDHLVEKRRLGPAREPRRLP
jgi:exodeoxyribonuclease III